MKKPVLSDYCEFLNGGAWNESEYTKSGVPVLKVSNMKKGGFVFDSIDYLSIENAKNYSKNLLKKFDVVIATVGSHPNLVDSAAGRATVIPKSISHYLLNQNAVCLRSKNKEELNQRYLGYLAKSEHFQNYIQNRGKGAANQMRIPIGDIKSYPSNLPTLSTQYKIAKILSAYDDLIENNIIRIKLLDEMAHTTYEDWFLRMKFPGYETAVFDKETGLPAGWKNFKVKNYVKTVSKGPSLNYDSDGQKYPVLNQSCIRNGEIELDKVLFSEKLSKNKQECYLEINDILINSMGQGTLGRVSKNVSIVEKFIIHNCITFLRAKNEYSQFMLFYFIASHKPYFESIAQGSTGQSTLKIELVSNLKLKLPTKEILNRFDKIISPIWKNIGVLKIQNQRLKEARDILLPRLMTGMIDVEKLEL
jgi:type I restriction enzyme, S subunit